jgi:hypothetical protein
VTVDPVAALGTFGGLVAVVATGFAYYRSSAVKVWQQNAEAYSARVDVLESQNEDLLKRIDKQDERIRDLEARPDWASVVRVVGVSEQNIIREIRAMLALVVTDQVGREALTAQALGAEQAKVSDALAAAVELRRAQEQ